MNKGSKAEVNKEGDTEQQNLFVDSSNVDLENKPVTTNALLAADDKSAMEMKTSMQEMKQNNSCCPNMTPFILMIALMVHSIFEGMALGLATTESATINMLIAIVIHKGAAGSSLGISLVKTFHDNFRLCR